MVKKDIEHVYEAFVEFFLLYSRKRNLEKQIDTVKRPNY